MILGQPARRYSLIDVRIFQRYDFGGIDTRVALLPNGSWYSKLVSLSDERSESFDVLLMNKVNAEATIRAKIMIDIKTPLMQ